MHRTTQTMTKQNIPSLTNRMVWESCEDHDKRQVSMNCVGWDIKAPLGLVGEEHKGLLYCLVVTRVFGHCRFMKSIAPMMHPIGCWKEKKVCYKMLCISVTNTDQLRTELERIFLFPIYIFLIFLLQYWRLVYIFSLLLQMFWTHGFVMTSQYKSFDISHSLFFYTSLGSVWVFFERGRVAVEAALCAQYLARHG